MKGRTFIYGFITGLTITSISVMMSAPSSGKELRSKMGRTKDDWIILLRDTKQNIIQLKDELLSATSITKDQVGVFVQDVKDAVEKWQEETGQHKEGLQRQINEIEVSIQDLEAVLSDMNKHNSKTV